MQTAESTDTCLIDPSQRNSQLPGWGQLRGRNPTEKGSCTSSPLISSALGMLETGRTTPSGRDGEAGTEWSVLPSGSPPTWHAVRMQSSSLPFPREAQYNLTKDLLRKRWNGKGLHLAFSSLTLWNFSCCPQHSCCCQRRKKPPEVPRITLWEEGDALSSDYRS